MKRIGLLLAAGGMMCAVAQAQSSAPRVTPSPRGRHGTASGPSANSASSTKDRRKVVKHVVPPPPTMMAHGAARKSTAQAMASRKNRPPLEALPSFSLTALTGESVAVSTLQHQGHWLMLYLRPNCAPCETVLQSLAGTERRQLQGGKPLLVVVRGHSTSEVTELRAKYPALGDAVWVLDQKGDGMKALKLASMPTLYALYDGGVAFTLPGTVGNPATVEKMAGTWMTRTDHVKPPATTGDAAGPMTATTPAAAGAETNVKK